MFYNFVAASDIWYLIYEIYLCKRKCEVFFSDVTNKTRQEKAKDFSSGRRNSTSDYNLESPERVLELILFSNVRRDDRHSPPTVTAATCLPQIFLPVWQPHAFFHRPSHLRLDISTNTLATPASTGKIKKTYTMQNSGKLFVRRGISRLNRKIKFCLQQLQYGELQIG